MKITEEQAATQAVNHAILAAHRLGEPRVLQLSYEQFRALKVCGLPADWNAGPPMTYRGLRLAQAADGACGRVLVWDRAREKQMVQLIRRLPEDPPA